VTHEVDITQYVLFDMLERESHLSLGYEYEDRNADGLNHDSHTHTASLGLFLALPLDFALDLAGFLARNDYPKFRGLRGKRKTDIYGANVALSRPITDSLSASVSYGYRYEDSSYPVLDCDRDVVTFVLGYTF